MDICRNGNKNQILDKFQGQESSSESGGRTFIEHSLDFVCTSAPCSCSDHDKNLTKSFENEDKVGPWGWLVPSHPTTLKIPVW